MDELDKNIGKDTSDLIKQVKKGVWQEIANKIKELCRIDTSLGLYNEALMALDLLKWLKEQIELQGQNDQSTNSIS